MKSNYLISEAASRVGVSRATLLYYDKINLLSPSHSHENGYRYYTYRDLEKLELIVTLKESGLSLKAIQSFLDQPSHQKGIHLLSQQREHVLEKMEELEKLQLILEKRIAMLEEYKNVEYYEGIRLNYYPGLSICKMDLNHQEPSPFESAVNALKEQLDKSIASYGSIPSKYGICMQLNHFLETKKLHYLYVYNYSIDPTDHLEILQLPDSYYVRCLHYGAYENAHGTLQKLLNYIHQHHYTIRGDAFLVPLTDLWAATTEADYQSEILIPVEIE